MLTQRRLRAFPWRATIHAGFLAGEFGVAMERIGVTHAGSLITPPELLAFLSAADRGQASADGPEYQAALGRAVDYVVRRQLETGIDLVDDGEMGKATGRTSPAPTPSLTGLSTTPRSGSGTRPSATRPWTTRGRSRRGRARRSGCAPARCATTGPRSTGTWPTSRPRWLAAARTSARRSCRWSPPRRPTGW